MRKVEEVGEPNLTTVRTINIELTRIDTLVGNDKMVVFLKIDTDGHELQALRGEQAGEGRRGLRESICRSNETLRGGASKVHEGEVESSLQGSDEESRSSSSPTLSRWGTLDH